MEAVNKIEKKSDKDNYYQINAEKIFQKLEKFLDKYLDQFLILSKQMSQKEEVKSKINSEMNQLISEIPFIGEKNYFTPALIHSSYLIAIYRSLDKHAFTDEEFGKVLFNISEINLRNKSFFGKLVLKLLFTSRLGKIYQKRSAKKSRESNYKNDLVFDYIDVDEKNYLFGFNFYNCPINDFFKEQGLQNLMPYYCLTDYADADFLKIRLKRTKTLSMGSDYCNHRYYKGVDSKIGWEPERFKDYVEWNKFN